MSALGVLASPIFINKIWYKHAGVGVTAYAGIWGFHLIPSCVACIGVITGAGLRFAY